MPRLLSPGIQRSAHHARNKKVKVANLQTGKLESEINFDPADIALAKEPEEARKVKGLLVGDQIRLARVCQLVRALDGLFPISRFIHKTKLESLLTRKDAAIGVVGPIARKFSALFV